MKIDPNFQYDAFRFVLSGVRNTSMEEWLGLPTGSIPEKSIQGWFERTQARIDQLPQLQNPDFEDTDLDRLLDLVGWDGSECVDFIDDVDEDTKRRLISLSVFLWKLKGTDAGLIGALRIFTGKTVMIRNWFYHRWILDEAGFWYEDKGEDPWLHGTRYTETDSNLLWVILNRTNLDAVMREVIYGLLTCIRGAGEHFGVVYAAFADDFGRGNKAKFSPGTPDEIPATFAQWENVGAVGQVDFSEDLQKAEMSADGGDHGSLRAQSTGTETWGPTQRVSAQIIVGSIPDHIGDYSFEMRGMISADDSEFYSIAINSSTGTLILSRDGIGGVVVDFPVPVDGVAFVVELLVEAINAGETRVTALLGGREVASALFVGVEAYQDSEGAVSLTATQGAFYVDNVIVLASPNRVQYVGQQAITPQVGFGGPIYIADPDPGLEPFEG